MIRYFFSLLLFAYTLAPVFAHEDAPRKIDGYRGIWFALGQKSEYGDKYSGGLGTYTAKHRPMAIYSAEANKTFFVYGGTTEANERHLLAMISYFDHATGKVPKPTAVHDKLTVNDPHDNPSLSIDGQGHLWVFVSGRAKARPGFIYRSVRPYDINEFELIEESEFTYPQPWWTADHGFLFLFTRYTRGRELYWSSSPDGREWAAAQKLVQGGHYQISEAQGNRVITAFNVHIPHGNVDTRTNLYFLQTDDMGRTWRTADGTTVQPPLDEIDNPALVRDYRKEGRLVYVKDIAFDQNSNPVVLYLTSGDYRPGPKGDPRTWTLAHWDGKQWNYREVTHSTHNYDMGSLYIEDDMWRIVAPTDAGPQRWGTGGEMVLWESRDQGQTWERIRNITQNSVMNQAYARRPVNAHPDFYAFWADGNPDEVSISHLYFTNRSGDKVWRLPYEMEGEFAEVEVVK